MQTVVFLDLDDTIFQTRPKCPPGENLFPAALDRAGQPLSFCTPRQLALSGHLEQFGTVIPTTARNRDAFRRVTLPFRDRAILDFGGVILLPDGQPDAGWDAQVRPLALRNADLLVDLAHEVDVFNRQRGLGLRVRLIRDLDMPLYVVLKHPEGDASRLLPVREEWLPAQERNGFRVHHNHNNLSLVPDFLGKEHAVRHILGQLGPVLSVGVGDSTSDGPFLRTCDFQMMPSSSQLADHSRLAAVRRTAWFCEPRLNEMEPEIVGASSPFSGSYDPADVVFLLKPVQVVPTPVEEKERLIQSGARHYSEMISPERLPSPAYLRLFEASLERVRERFARHLLTLADLLTRSRPGPLTVVSLARAGTPVGVLLTRLLRRLWRREVAHYSISIIRDRGIDANALRFLLDRHSPNSVAFVDGWTGKGVIAAELERAVAAYNASRGCRLDPGLWAVVDLSGTAGTAASADDYLIPSSVLGATVSGLVSRSILNREVVGPDDFHGCLFLEELRAADRSGWFADVVEAEAVRQWRAGLGFSPGVTVEERAELRRRSTAFVAETLRRYGVKDINHLKPGIGEATRVLLRRVPDRLLLREAAADETAHLRLLAQEKQVPLVVEPALPYRAAALIKEVD